MRVVEVPNRQDYGLSIESLEQIFVHRIAVAVMVGYGNIDFAHNLANGCLGINPVVILFLGVDSSYVASHIIGEFAIFEAKNATRRVLVKRSTLRCIFGYHWASVCTFASPNFAIACDVFSSDPRVRSVSYERGIWSAELHLDEVFNVPRSGEYFRRFKICYPVDSVGMPCIYLSMQRLVCSNGSTAQVAEFRTDIEINDESGLHLSRLLASFNNQYGFSALEERLGIAQSTAASVNELLEIDNLLQNHVADKRAYRMLHNRLDEVAGEPCFQYGTTSLNNIPAKKRSLLPVNCSVNDLLNFCSELTSHHGNLLDNAVSFDVAAGKILAHEFDLEGMYGHRKKSPDFFLKDLKLSTARTSDSIAREESMEFIDV